jgi:hypothetical protein
MYVLGSWATINVALSALQLSRTRGSTQAFHQMNLGWGAINLGLAGIGIWNSTHGSINNLDLFASQEELHKIQRTFLFNAGLDVGYMVAGLWMRDRSHYVTKNTDRMRGFGQSILLQGAFLFVFDLGAYFYHKPLIQELKPLFPPNTEVRIGMIPHGLGLTIGFR